MDVGHVSESNLRKSRLVNCWPQYITHMYYPIMYISTIAKSVCWSGVRVRPFLANLVTYHDSKLGISLSITIVKGTLTIPLSHCTIAQL